MNPEPNIKEYFYKDELNISLPLIKKGCNWIVLNMPDFTNAPGWQKAIINIGLLIFILYLSSLLFIEGITIWGLITKIVFIGIAATFFYSKSVAFMSLKFVEQYQEKAEKVLSKG